MIPKDRMLLSIISMRQKISSCRKDIAEEILKDFI